MDSTAKGEENGHITQNPKESKTIHKKMINRYTQEAISGNEIVESSSQMGLLKATEILEEDSRWQERILLELGSHEREEADAYKRFHEEEEQIDYEPPHKKTPIHNK
ncbi:uncharacterized protein LOC130763873 [Actinidia eriantha]|uniref:uncharacterized protein LOC130763873 n=1 Tax=Actinidia eriantha TaxID=165200 RepID=UPI00258FF5F3|nr:uncharacterized protein LOC130763873 [Actinidia eriantha]